MVAPRVQAVMTAFDLPGGCPHYAAVYTVLAAPVVEGKGTIRA